MNNPFTYGGVITGEAFCNREQELKDILSTINNGQKLFIYSERRCGKTSLVKKILNQLPKKNYASAYIDIWPTDDIESFITATAKAIVSTMSTTQEKMIENAKSLFRRLSPTMSFDDEGKPIIRFGLKMDDDRKASLEEVLEAPLKIAAAGNRRVVIVFDEFQQIAEYKSDLVERHIRSIVQQQEHVSYLFLGSRRHLLKRMFLDKSRPLYRSAGHYPIYNIELKHWEPFIREKFSQANKTISKELVNRLCQYTEGHPFYTQHLCYVLWELTDEHTSTSEDHLEKALDILLDRESYAYSNLWEALTLNQRRLLKGIALAGERIKPFEGEFIKKHDLSAASSVQRAIEALIERDIIDKEHGRVAIVDRLFRVWVTRMGQD